MYPQFDDLSQMLRKHRQGTVLVDANLLLLYFIGSLDPQEIPRFKRTKQFVVEDYDTLSGFLKYFKTILTTPNILTEVSNLSTHLPKHLRDDYLQVFTQSVALLEERYCASQTITTMPEMPWLGLTDTGIVHLAQAKHLVITEDAALYAHLTRQGLDALNFNHIRPLNWR